MELIPRILIISELESEVEYLKKILNSSGLNSIYAKDCNSAVNKIKINSVDLILLMTLLIKREEKPEGLSLNEIEDLRYKIDQCDDELIHILEKRMDLVNHIGNYKKENNMTILQPGRWDQVLNKSIKKGVKGNLNKDFISAIFKSIHQESINIQTTIMNE